MKKLLFFFFLFCSVFVFGQATYPDKPNPPKLVNDLTGTLSGSETATLERRLVDFDNQTTNQVTVVIIPTTNGVEPSEYATELGRKWGIGNKVNNGVLLLIAKDDRKLSIVVGYGLEGKLTDATSQSIIDNEIVPHFKAGNYYQGISNGVESIVQATQGAYKADKAYQNRGKRGKGGGWFQFIIIIIIIVFIFGASRGGGGRGGGMMSRRGYRGVNNPIWWLPMGGGGGFGGGGGGGSSGGGGFGGFGGGSFGGGGSSGSW